MSDMTHTTPNSTVNTNVSQDDVYKQLHTAWSDIFNVKPKQRNRSGEWTYERFMACKNTLISILGSDVERFLEPGDVNRHEVLIRIIGFRSFNRSPNRSSSTTNKTPNRLSSATNQSQNQSSSATNQLQNQSSSQQVIINLQVKAYSMLIRLVGENSSFEDNSFYHDFNQSIYTENVTVSDLEEIIDTLNVL